MGQGDKWRSIEVLATDLDGTLIPELGVTQQQRDLQRLVETLREREIRLVYVTGRSRESTLDAIERLGLPKPEAIIAEVGAALHHRTASGYYELDSAYAASLAERMQGSSLDEQRALLAAWDELSLQPPEGQGACKASFYFDFRDRRGLEEKLHEFVARSGQQWHWVMSRDPGSGRGLLDLLPHGVDKSHGLAWWLAQAGCDSQNVLVAGDSGNDLAMLASAPAAILVSNADHEVKRSIREVFHDHRRQPHRLHAARGRATSGVLEGLRWFVGESIDEEIPDRLGATAIHHDAAHFLIWAPRCETLEVELEGDVSERHALSRAADGWFQGTLHSVSPGTHYQLVLDGERRRPDPASRFQPRGVHRVSRVERHLGYPWTDQGWRGVPKRDLVIYELHVGTLTDEGTLRAAIARLSELAELGITAIELMPLAASPGGWNWGYDGVHPFALRETLGEPEDLKRLVDEAHRLGLAVLLDVVYNHLGPEGNYLSEFAPYFSAKHRTPWGEAFDFDGDCAHEVRRYVIENSLRWLDEYHLDGLRLDAVHFMFDESEFTILDELSAAVHALGRASGRELHLIAESNVFDDELLVCHPRRPAYGAIWADCAMHSIYSVALPELKLTHRRYRGVRDVAEALQFGYLYEGRESRRVEGHELRKRHQASGGLEHMRSLILALQTHDSVGNHPRGSRLHQLTSVDFQRAAAALVLLHPAIPMIFMGEEVATSAPFPFFVDFEDPRLRRVVDEGRVREYPHHDWSGSLAPSDPQAFYRAKIAAAPSDDPEMRSWYRSLLTQRQQCLASGRLMTESFGVEHDESTGLIALTYRDSSGNPAWGVVSRLVPVADAERFEVEISVPGSVVLRSRPDVTCRGGKWVLRGNRALVWDLLAVG